MELQRAKPLQRLFGFLIDCVVCLIVLMIISYGEDYDIGVVGFLVTVLNLVIKLYMMSKSTSIGKKMVGLVVCDKETGKPLGFWKMFIREVIGKFISGTVLCVGYIWILLDKDNQGWHDKLVGSVVYTEDSMHKKEIKEKLKKMGDT